VSRVADGALAAGVLAGVVALGAAVHVDPSPRALAAGAVAAVLLEVLVSARATTVRALWARPVVRLVSVVVVVLVAALATVFRPESGLNALAGGLLAYLGLLAVVAVGLVPPSTGWFEHGR
jgi:hypothetical protein